MDLRGPIQRLEHQKRTLLAAVVALIGFATASHAATVGFDLTIGGDLNVPTVTVTNTSTSAEIVGLDMFIGNTLYNFDYVQAVGSQPLTWTDNVGTENNVRREDLVEFSFSSFGLTDTFT